jgi:hypothetical protein
MKNQDVTNGILKNENLTKKLKFSINNFFIIAFCFTLLASSGALAEETTINCNNNCENFETNGKFFAHKKDGSGKKHKKNRKNKKSYSNYSKKSHKKNGRMGMMKKMKLLNILELPEAEADKFLAKYSSYETKIDENLTKMKVACRELDSAIKNKLPDAKAKSDKVIALQEESFKLSIDKIKDMKSVLPDDKYSKYVLFEQSYFKNMFGAMMENKKKRTFDDWFNDDFFNLRKNMTEEGRESYDDLRKKFFNDFE